MTTRLSTHARCREQGEYCHRWIGTQSPCCCISFRILYVPHVTQNAYKCTNTRCADFSLYYWWDTQGQQLHAMIDGKDRYFRRDDGDWYRSWIDTQSLTRKGHATFRTEHGSGVTTALLSLSRGWDDEQMFIVDGPVTLCKLWYVRLMLRKPPHRYMFSQMPMVIWYSFRTRNGRWGRVISYRRYFAARNTA